jgi:ABC-type transporter Mla subunit MlaD
VTPGGATVSQRQAMADNLRGQVSQLFAELNNIKALLNNASTSLTQLNTSVQNLLPTVPVFTVRPLERGPC